MVVHLNSEPRKGQEDSTVTDLDLQKKVESLVRLGEKFDFKYFGKVAAAINKIEGIKSPKVALAEAKKSLWRLRREALPEFLVETREMIDQVQSKATAESFRLRLALVETELATSFVKGFIALNELKSDIYGALKDQPRLIEDLQPRISPEREAYLAKKRAKVARNRANRAARGDESRRTKTGGKN